MLRLLLIFSIWSPSAFAVAPACDSLLKTSPVLTSFAERSPHVRQIYATSAYDAVLGILQDHLLKTSNHLINRVGPHAIFLQNRTRDFLDGWRGGSITAEEAKEMANGMSLMQAQYYLNSMRLPLTTDVDPNTKVHTLLRETVNFVETQLARGQKAGLVKEQALQSLASRLSAEEGLTSEFFQVTSIGVSQPLTPSPSTIRKLVQSNALVLVGLAIQSQQLDYFVRLHGYVPYRNGRIKSVILKDTAGLANLPNGLWELSFKDFATRLRALHRIAIEGQMQVP